METARNRQRRQQMERMDLGVALAAPAALRGIASVILAVAMDLMQALRSGAVALLTTIGCVCLALMFHFPPILNNQ